MGGGVGGGGEGGGGGGGGCVKFEIEIRIWDLGNCVVNGYVL